MASMPHASYLSLTKHEYKKPTELHTKNTEKHVLAKLGDALDGVLSARSILWQEFCPVPLLVHELDMLITGQPHPRISAAH
jgi:hypothetical protein